MHFKSPMAKLYIMAENWSIIGLTLAAFAIAGEMKVPWDAAAARQHVELTDDDGAPTLPIRSSDRVEGSELEGDIQGSSQRVSGSGSQLDIPLALRFWTLCRST